MILARGQIVEDEFRFDRVSAPDRHLSTGLDGVRSPGIRPGFGERLPIDGHEDSGRIGEGDHHRCVLFQTIR